MIMMILNITAVKEIDSLDMLRRQSVIEKLLQRYPDFCSQIYTNQAHRRIPNLPSLNNCTMLIHFVRNRFCKIMFYGVHLFTFTLLNAPLNGNICTFLPVGFFINDYFKIVSGQHGMLDKNLNNSWCLFFFTE